MVRLTRAGEYAVRGMVYLARQQGETLALIPDIAKAQGVSPSFLAKIFQSLTKAGLVESQRGAAGGVSLGRLPEKISLREIVEAVEGPLALNECLLPRDACRNRETCPLACVWSEAQQKMLAVLDGATLDHFNGSPGPSGGSGATAS